MYSSEKKQQTKLIKIDNGETDFPYYNYWTEQDRLAIRVAKTITKNNTVWQSSNENNITACWKRESMLETWKKHDLEMCKSTFHILTLARNISSVVYINWLSVKRT